ncbi:MAG: glycosyltransferase [Candidatus Kaiserbacteria bacterium]|nr:glycosyltransferase [Candidatus Kaiserbacteria bacterium]
MEAIAKKKILFVITKSNWGGAQRYVYDLATVLPKAEFDVNVAFGQPGRLADELHRAGITTHPILSLQRDISLGADVKSFFELVRLFRIEKPDIVHLNSSKAAGIGALAARFAGIHKIIFTAHGWPFWEPRNPLSRALIYFFSWITALLSHKIIVISDYDLCVARRMPFIEHKVTRIHNGIDPHMAFGSGEKIRNAFPPGAVITGTIGELNRNKNQQALIEQAKNNPDMFVAIVGEGENRRMLEEQIKKYNLSDRVKLFGFIPAREVLLSFDVFALPSLKEGLPYVLLEAKLAGLPIMANRVGGVGEILDSKNPEEFSLAHMVEKTTLLYRS